jgi:hypothetical protein
MALSSEFKFTNTAAGTATITRTNLGLLDNYALAQDSGNEAVLVNKTAPIDALERVSYQTRNIQRVDTSLEIAHPDGAKAIQYRILEEATLVTTDSTDSTFRVDSPITAQLIIRHPKAGFIGNDEVGTVVKRLLSACMREDGTWRFDDLMRSAERPVVE